ncbi:class I adenylate-forming enzyme family protein [Martelella soudanensis]|uniref:class I adenylate-forming enzyme family protein n=1 Tax=unclassified Martelella TaxID=2629616 RepID=UPI0015DFB801|nr:MULTISPECIES: class I adenylate-forming enzyme family protein [unclassified Martelella]
MSEEGGLIAAILGHADTRPEDTALICNGETASWGQLRGDVLATAGALSAHGDVGRVALLGTADIGLVTAYLAIIAAGGCAVPLPASAHPDALAGMLADCEPALVFVEEGYAGLVPEAYAGRVVRLDADVAGSVPADFRNEAPPLAAPVTADPDAPFNIIYSSGTTGRAKGIVHPHRMRYRQAARTLFGLDAGSTMLLATPLYSNTTLMPMLSALHHGARVALMQKFDAERYLELAESLGATHTMLVPVQYQRILAADSFGKRDLSAFRVKQSTGAPLPAAAKRAILDHWPGDFFEVYGLTEGGCTAILDAARHPDKAHTVGKPAAGNTIRIIDDDGNDVRQGERGEIIGRSAMMMSGYFRNDEANRAFYWHDRDGTLYHRTGDIGMFDEDGFLVLLDRKKDMIISGGFNIYASDLEEKLLSHPGVLEAAVIAIPSDKWGETPLGFVVAKNGAALEPQALRDWVNQRLGRMQKIAAVEIRDALPRNSGGKVLKQELRKPYWEKRA